jgi:hypothetical protein
MSGKIFLSLKWYTDRNFLGDGGEVAEKNVPKKNFHAMMAFCLDLLRSKFWLIGEWSII